MRAYVYSIVHAAFPSCAVPYIFLLAVRGRADLGVV